jgi:hypothetical protein
MRLLLLLVPLLLAAPVRALDPVDLTEHLAPRPDVGDYKVWELRGVGEVREEVIAVFDEADGYRIERQYTERGVYAGTSEELVIPRVETRLTWASGERPEAASILGIGDTWPLSLKPGRRDRFHFVYIPYYIAPGCCYEQVIRGSHRFTGFADWLGLRAVHTSAAMLTSRATWRSRNTRPGTFTWVWSPRIDGDKTERAFVEGVGLVGASAAYRTLRNGVVTSRLAEEIELVEAVVQGAPYPPSP